MSRLPRLHSAREAVNAAPCTRGARGLFPAFPEYPNARARGDARKGLCEAVSEGFRREDDSPYRPARKLTTLTPQHAREVKGSIPTIPTPATRARGSACRYTGSTRGRARDGMIPLTSARFIMFGTYRERARQDAK